MLRKVNGKWALVSKRTLRPLAYYNGEGKPSDEWVSKQERRVQAFKHGFSEELCEAAYEGNIGVMELFKFHNQATPEQKKQLKDHIQNKRTKDAWQLVRDVTGVNLHKSVEEAVSSDILPKSGAGAWGTDELTNTYKRDTPGQEPQKKKKVLSFANYNK